MKRIFCNLFGRTVFVSIAVFTFLMDGQCAEPMRFGFSGPEIFPVENQIGQLRAADVDGDGRTDLLVVNNARSRINILLNRTGSTNTARKAVIGAKRQLNELPPDARFQIESVASEKRISAMVATDLNGDSREDIAYYGEPKELIVLYNQGTNRWSAPRRWAIDDGQLNPNALSAGDINGDERTDLVVLGENQVHMLLQDKDGGLGEAVRIPFSGTARSVQILDLDDDRRNDLLLVNWEDRNPIRFRQQQANGALGPEIYFPFTPIRSYWADTLEDKSRIRLITIAQNSGRAQVSEFKQEPAEKITEGVDQGQFKVLPLEQTAKARRGIRWADVNSDQLPDLLIADPEKGQVSIILQAPDGSLGTARTFPSLAGVTDIAAADWNSDGSPELFLLSPDERQAGVTRFDSNRSISFPELIQVNGRPLVLATGRLNPKDSPLLAMVVDDDGKRSVLIRNAEGKSRRIALDESFRGNPTFMAFEDADQDGMMDLVILTPYEKIKVLRQKAEKEFTEIDVAPPGGLIEQPWLSTADIDSDGKPELLITQRNFLRAVVLEQNPGTQSGTNRTGWSFRVKEQINGADSNSRITGAASFQPTGRPSPVVFLLDAERKALTVCERADGSPWRIVKNVPLPVADFNTLQPITLGGTNVNAIALLGLNLAGLMPLSGQLWSLAEIDSYETPVRQGHLTDVTSGDLDNDGHKDLVFLETARNYVDVVAVNADGKLEPANRWQVFEEKTFRSRRGDLPEPREALITDLTGDGKQDLAIIVHDRILLYPQE